MTGNVRESRKNALLKLLKRIFRRPSGIEHRGQINEALKFIVAILGR
jgi:hypothetical protein